MNNLDQIKHEIDQIKARNKRVEADKAWETSFSRKIIVFIFTYTVIVLLFIFAKLPDPFINAIVPSLAFVISTLGMTVFKKLWIKNIYKTR